MLKKLINNYARGYALELVTGNVPAPGSSDCWHCYMADAEGTPMGEIFKDSGHLLTHIQEEYYVPSLLRRAIHVVPVSMKTLETVYYFWGNHSDSPTAEAIITAQEETAKSLREYMKQQLGVA